MKGWLIYNGTNQVLKITQLIQKLKQDADRLGLSLELIKNNELLPYYDRLSMPRLAPYGQPDCDFVLFWDKDVFLAKHLEEMGCRVFNSSAAIGVCDNKLLMHQQLSRSGLPIPKTILGPFVYHQQSVSKDHYQNIVSLLGEPFLLKEGKGSFGAQVYLISSYEDYQERLPALGSKSFLFQEFISSSRGRDIRVSLIGDEVIGAMERINETDFRANITLGGSGRIISLTPEQKELAVNAHRLLGLTFSGVDLLYGSQGEPILCEVNSNVNFLSYEAVSGINFGALILEHVIGCLK
jgi:RimK family alpha-L-glutamate ligase